MLDKIRTKIHALHFHPLVTLTATLTGIVSAASIVGSEASQIGIQLGPLTTLLPKTNKVIADLAALATICTVISGLGKSFIPLVAKKQPDVPAQ